MILKYLKYKKIKSRADYGTYLIKYLSERLTKEFGRGFDSTNLKRFRKFYEYFHNSEFAPQQGAYLKGIDDIRSLINNINK